MTRIRMQRIPPRARGLSESYAAHVTMPLGYGVGDDGDAVISVSGVGWSFGSALRKATSIAKHITDDPIVRAILPPQARVALAAARRLSTAAKHGRAELKEAWKSLPPELQERTRPLANKMLKAIDSDEENVAGFFSKLKKVARGARKLGKAGLKYGVPGYAAAMALKKKLKKKKRRPVQEQEQYEDEPMPAEAEMPDRDGFADVEPAAEPADNGEQYEPEEQEQYDDDNGGES